MSTSEIRVTNIGAIQELTIPVKPGTVTVLTGPNGAGKSTAIEVVKTVATGQKGSLTPHDGKKSGQIRIPGCTIKIGGRLSKQGEPEQSFAIVEDGGGIAQLIDPGIKDPVAADKRRIQSLLAAAGAETDWAEIQEYLGEALFEEFHAGCKVTELVDVVAELKKFLQKKARTAESEVDTATGAIEAIGDIPEAVEVADIDALREQSTQATKQRDSLQSRFETQQETLKALEGFDVDLDDIRVGESLLESLQTQKTSLQKLLVDIQEQLQKVETQIEVKCGALETAKENARRFQSMKAAVKELVTEQQLQDATVAASEAAQSYETAVAAKQDAERHAANRAKLVSLKAKREQSEAAAAKCRELSDGATGLLSSAVSRFEGWSVNEDLRLCCEHTRGVIPFADLSPGERAIRAIQVRFQSFEPTNGEIPIAAIPQEVWESLDAANQSILRGWIAGSEIAVVTARAATDIEQKTLRVQELF